MATQLKHTVKPSAGDYTTLADALAGIKADHGADLTSIDKYLDIEIDGTWASADTAAVDISGWVTSATCYINIYTTAAARQDPHGSAWDTGAYRLSVTDAHAFVIDEEYVRCVGLQVESVSPAANLRLPFYILSGVDVRIANSVVKGHNHGTYTQTLIYMVNTGTTYIWNTLLYNLAVVANNVQIRGGGAGTYLVYNVTGIGGEEGFWNSGGTATTKNCYFGGATYCYDGTIAKTTCASSDNSGSDAALRGILVSTTEDATHAGFVNVSAGTEDYHIKSSSPLKGVGTDTSGDSAPMNFVDDIDGDSRV